MTSTTTITTPETELSEDILEGFRLRAGELDRANAYFDDDLQELRDTCCTATSVAAAFTPGNDALTHEVVGKSVLGILAEQPRW